MRSNISPGLLTNEILLSSMFDISSPASGRFRALGRRCFPWSVIQPVVELDTRIACEVLRVVCDKHHVKRNCMGGDQLV